MRIFFYLFVAIAIIGILYTEWAVAAIAIAILPLLCYAQHMYAQQDREWRKTHPKDQPADQPKDSNTDS